MAHIGFLSLYATGHLNPALALGRALNDRGHTVTFFNIFDTRSAVEAQGVSFVPFGQDVYPAGTLRATFETIGRLQGAAAFGYFLERMVLLAQTSFRDLPALLREHHTDLLVVDQLFPGGATVAQHLGLPFVSLAAAVAVNPDLALPPPTLPWPYADSAEARARNEKGWQGIHQAFTPWREADNAQRQVWGLPPYADLLRDSMSPLAQLSQTPAAFDLPRDTPPAHLHFVGPLNHPAAREALAARLNFPWDRLTGQPLVYASMGTLQNGLDWVFRTILSAAASLDIQLVLSLGGGTLDASSLGDIPPNGIVLPYVPQFDLLPRAAACITHAGLNTALDAITHGVPTVAIPITNDQPGVAARLQHTGAGVLLPLDQLTPETLVAALRRVLDDPSFRVNAQRLQAAIATLDPLGTACTLVEAQLPG